MSATCAARSTRPSGGRRSRPCGARGTGWWPMVEGRLPTRSVRVRITAAATVVVGLAIAGAGWALVRSVERSLESKVAAQAQQQIAFVTGQLTRGVDPAQVTVPPAGGIVQVFSGGQ